MLNNSHLQSKIYDLQNQNAVLQCQVSTLSSQISSLLKDKEKKLEKERKLFVNLQMMTDNKDHELEKKERKIKELKELLGKSREEIIDYKLKAKKGRLETFIKKLGIDRGKIRELRNAYQQLVRVGANNGQGDIGDFSDKIESIKDELIDKRISIVDAQKVCQKCEKIAKLKAEQDTICKERFEARQEESVRMLEGRKDEETIRRITYEEDRDGEQEENEVQRLGYGYSSQSQNNFSQLSVEEQEALNRFYKNREKEVRDYKHEKSLSQNQPTLEEKIWSLEEQLESLDNNLRADESELVFLEWRLEQNNTLYEEVNEKKVLRQQSIKKLKIKKEMKDQRIAELRLQVEVPPKEHCWMIM